MFPFKNISLETEAINTVLRLMVFRVNNKYLELYIASSKNESIFKKTFVIL